MAKLQEEVTQVRAAATMTEAHTTQAERVTKGPDRRSYEGE
jgi:hypothetical protein